MRQLILYYSRTGSNEKLCQELQQKLGCDIEQIIDSVSRKGLLNFIKSGFAALTKKTTTIEPIKSNFAYYDLVILGTPFWVGSLPPASRTFLEQYKDKLKRLALISVSGTGTANKNTKAELEAVSGKRFEPYLSISEKQFKQKAYLSELDDFIRVLKSFKNVKGDLSNP